MPEVTAVCAVEERSSASKAFSMEAAVEAGHRAHTGRLPLGSRVMVRSNSAACSQADRHQAVSKGQAHENTGKHYRGGLLSVSGRSGQSMGAAVSQ